MHELADKDRDKIPEDLAAKIMAEMPSPEEIMKMAEIEEHNEKIELVRQERLRQRQERRAKRGKLRKRRK